MGPLLCTAGLRNIKLPHITVEWTTPFKYCDCKSFLGRQGGEDNNPSLPQFVGPNGTFCFCHCYHATSVCVLYLSNVQKFTICAGRCVNSVLIGRIGGVPSSSSSSWFVALGDTFVLRLTFRKKIHAQCNKIPRRKYLLKK